MEEKITINALFDMHMKAKQKLIRDNTMYRYTKMYNKYLRKQIGELYVEDVSYSEILTLYSELYGKLSRNTVKFLNAILHSMFRTAQRNRIISFNPCDNIMRDLKEDRINRTRVEVLTKEEVNIFLAAVKQNEEYTGLYELFYILFGTGLRSGELCALTWNNIDLENKEIIITNNVTYNNVKKREEVSQPKTQAGYRIIPMLPEIYEILNSLKDKNGNEYIFTRQKDQLYTNQILNKAIKSIVEKYNQEAEFNHQLPLFTCHMARKTFCSRLCEQNINPKVLQEIMGHSSIQVTMDIYTRLTKQFKKNSLEKYHIF